jgi:hypothetical protein
MGGPQNYHAGQEMIPKTYQNEGSSGDMYENKGTRQNVYQGNSA